MLEVMEQPAFKQPIEVSVLSILLICCSEFEFKISNETVALIYCAKFSKCRDQPKFQILPFARHLCAYALEHIKHYN